MKSLLLIDTASPHCAVGLQCNGVISQRQTGQERQSAQKVLPLIVEVMAEAGIEQADLDAIGVISGPGSFTGMRIGVAIAQGLGFANDKAVVPVSSLAATAYSAFSRDGCSDWLVAMQAREDEVYLGGFRCTSEAGIETLIDELLVSGGSGEDLAKSLAGCTAWGLAGDVDAVNCPGLMSAGVQPIARYTDATISMAALARLVEQKLATGAVFDASAALPNYVKEQLQYG